MFPRTGNSHEVSGQLADAHLDLLMSGFAEDTCEDGMRHLCLNALGRNVIRHHRLGGTGCSAMGRCLVGSDDDADDSNEKNTGSSIPVLGMCDDVGNGYSADNSNGSSASLVPSLKQTSIRGCIEKGCGIVLKKNEVL